MVVAERRLRGDCPCILADPAFWAFKHPESLPRHLGTEWKECWSLPVGPKCLPHGEGAVFLGPGQVASIFSMQTAIVAGFETSEASFHRTAVVLCFVCALCCSENPARTRDFSNLLVFHGFYFRHPSSQGLVIFRFGPARAPGVQPHGERGVGAASDMPPLAHMNEEDDHTPSIVPYQPDMANSDLCASCGIAKMVQDHATPSRDLV